jgi:2-amino-4-hydroxy-6-hydroxymethyldihydropteridine diphosphokinase
LSELAYLSLGSNLGDRLDNLQAALDSLTEAGVVMATSSFYETEPVELTNQPWFLNCVAALATEQSPQSVLSSILSVEQKMGRVRLKNKGPRIIDIDIVLFGDRVLDKATLQIPHPALHKRRFVLEPLVEIAPLAFHPTLKKTAQELLAALPDGQIVRRLDIAR